VAVIGYARVSTREEGQILDRQMDAFKVAGCDRVFEDRASGARADRPGLAACLDYLRSGDILVVLDLDRLGRRAGELIRLVDELESRGIGFRALNASFDTTTPAGRAFLQIQAAFAEMERNLIRQRVNEGLAAARARGRNGGRPRVMTLERLRYAQHLMADQTRSIPAICHELGDMPASTLYHYLHADGSLKAPARRLLDPDMQAGGAVSAGEPPAETASSKARRAHAVA
jgi:DNA invertase Pin-like site-specific DNA recombinase